MPRKKKKPGFNPDKSMEELVKALAEAYGSYDDRVDENHKPSLNALADEFGLNVIKVRKLLITAGVYSTAVSRGVAELMGRGYSPKQIGDELGLSMASINSYLPYKGIAYKMPESSVDADRAKVYRGRKNAVERLQSALNEDVLWDAVIQFQGYGFFTASGLPFSYVLKKGRTGTFNKELIVSRRKESKTLAWSSIIMAFNRALEMQGTVVRRPKALGDIRGISYIYPMLYRFGIIEVSEKTAEKMKVKGRNYGGDETGEG